MLEYENELWKPFLNKGLNGVTALQLTVKTPAKNWSIFYARWLKVDPFETFFNVLWTIDKELN